MSVSSEREQRKRAVQDATHGWANMEYSHGPWTAVRRGEVIVVTHEDDEFDRYWTNARTAEG